MDQLEENPRNSYSQVDIEDLAESIQVIGLQQPLVVVPVEDGHFRILAGHRRRSALEMLERETAPCVVLDADLDPPLRTLILHWTNTLARGGAGLTGEGIYEAAKEIKEALLDLKQRGVLELPGKLRAYVADVLKVSEGAIAREDSINFRTCPRRGKPSAKNTASMTRSPTNWASAVRSCNASCTTCTRGIFGSWTPRT